MEKIFLKRFYGTLTVVLMVIAGIVILFDPFYHYHDAIGGMKRVLQDRDYQVAGTLDHFDYDAVLLGTSTAENNNIDQFRENFGIRIVKAIRAGGSNADFLYYLDRAYQHQELKRVFYFIDFTALEGALKPTFDRMDTDYITNGNPLDDTKYLFNKDILLKKIPLQFVYSYSWYQIKTFSKEAILGRYYPRDNFEKEHTDEAAYQNFSKNIELILERVKNHPETEYTFVFSPVSILWWDDVYRQGAMGQKLQETEEFVKAMETMENVKVYYFQNDRDLAGNLGYYMDSVHFSYEVNRELCDRIARDENRMDGTNCREILEDLYRMVEEFSTNGILAYYPDAVVE